MPKCQFVASLSAGAYEIDTQKYVCVSTVNNFCIKAKKKSVCLLLTSICALWDVVVHENTSYP